MCHVTDNIWRGTGVTGQYEGCTVETGGQCSQHDQNEGEAARGPQVGTSVVRSPCCQYSALSNERILSWSDITN